MCAFVCVCVPEGDWFLELILSWSQKQSTLSTCTWNEHKNFQVLGCWFLGALDCIGKVEAMMYGVLVREICAYCCLCYGGIWPRHASAQNGFRLQILEHPPFLALGFGVSNVTRPLVWKIVKLGAWFVVRTSHAEKKKEKKQRPGVFVMLNANDPLPNGSRANLWLH